MAEPETLVTGADLQDIEALLAASMEHEVDGVGYQVLPKGYEIVVPDVEKHLLHPYRPKGTATFSEVASFVEYVAAHKGSGTAVWANSSTHELAAILDGHAPAHVIENERAGWGQHRASFKMRYTTSWTAWMGFTGAWQLQEDFANFLEERIGDIADPPGAALFEIVRTLRVRVNAIWENIINTAHDGVQFRWQEEVNTGDVTMPEQLALVLTPFDGGAPVLIKARLRYTKPDSHGKVKFRFVLGEESQRVIDEAFDDICKTVLAGTAVPLYRGGFV